MSSLPSPPILTRLNTRPRNHTVPEYIDAYFQKEDIYDEADPITNQSGYVEMKLLDDSNDNDNNIKPDYQWKFRHTVSYWICVGFVIGAIPYIIGNLADIFKSQLEPLDYYTLYSVAFFVGGIANLIASYCAYHEVINEAYHSKRNKSNNRKKIWLFLRGKKTMNYWTSLVFLIANITTLIPKLCAALKIKFDKWSIQWILIDQIAISVTVVFLLIGGLLQLYINKGWKWRPYRLGWIISWTNTIAAFCLVIPGVFTSWFDNDNYEWNYKLLCVQIFWLAGAIFYFISSVLSLVMWKLQQFGLAILPSLNRIKNLNKKKRNAILYRDIFFIFLYCMTATTAIFAIVFAIECKPYSDWIKNFVLSVLLSVSLLGIGSFLHREPEKAPFSYLLWFIRIYMIFYTINLFIDVYHISGTECERYGAGNT